jgi:hypothetical protein
MHSIQNLLEQNIQNIPFFGHWQSQGLSWKRKKKQRDSNEREAHGNNLRISLSLL